MGLNRLLQHELALLLDQSLRLKVSNRASYKKPAQGLKGLDHDVSPVSFGSFSLVNR
jgi:hypothetical protein